MFIVVFDVIVVVVVVVVVFVICVVDVAIVVAFYCYRLVMRPFGGAC